MAATRLSALIRRAPAPLAAYRRLSGRTGAGWRAYLIRTVTGQLGPSLDPVAGSWSVELNGNESGSVTVRKSDLGGVPPRWFTPWYGGVLFTYTHAGIERPIVAGPITGWPSESPDEITFDFGGIRSVLARRFIVAEDGVERKRDITVTGLSYGDTAWQAVRHALNRADGGLPIVHGHAPEPWPAADPVVFNWWNIPNLNVDAYLSEVSGYEKGPDIMFRPEWSNDDKASIRWVMKHGSVQMPAIPQNTMPDWDTTAPRSDVNNVSVRSSAETMTTRVWVTGSGEEKGTIVNHATAPDFVNWGGPFLESVISQPDQTNRSKLYAMAAGELGRSGDMADQVSMTVRAADPKAPMGLWFVGDNANITLAGHLSIPDGSRFMRIIKASGGLDDSVSVEFQEDSW